MVVVAPGAVVTLKEPPLAVELPVMLTITSASSPPPVKACMKPDAVVALAALAKELVARLAPALALPLPTVSGRLADVSN